MHKLSFDADAFIDAAAPLLGLTIDPAHRPGVVQNLERIAGIARLLMDEPMPPEDQPAPVFEP